MNARETLWSKWGECSESNPDDPTRWELIVYKLYSMIPKSCAHMNVNPVWQYALFAFERILYRPDVLKIVNYSLAQTMAADIRAEIDAEILKSIFEYKDANDETI